MKKISSWGNTSKLLHKVNYLLNKKNSLEIVSSKSKGIVYGMGRSYGDVCLNHGKAVYKNKYLDRLLSFDDEKGEIECESGVCIKDLQDFLITKGWMLPVTPGTEYVSIGGAIANDIHGKNHHKYGTFGNHVKEILLIRSDSEPIICSKEINKEIFQATIGGIGLTGIIYSCKIRLKKIPGPWLETESIAFDNLESFYDIADKSEDSWEYTAAWIDCLSNKSIRGIFERGNHINLSKKFSTKSINFPFTPPFSFVNKLSLRIFNPIYYYLKKLLSNKSVQHYKSFLHPLDKILNWNRMYGTKGFYQFQCVIPRKNSQEAISSILSLMKSHNSGSFLAVLKTFSDYKSIGLLSFAEPGVTLALDFANNGKITKKLFSKLEHTVASFEGKVYLAKDALMSKEVFESSYRNLEKYKEFLDPNLSSSMSRRLIGK